MVSHRDRGTGGDGGVGTGIGVAGPVRVGNRGPRHD